MLRISKFSNKSKALPVIGLMVSALALGACSKEQAQEGEKGRPVLVATVHYQAQSPERSFVGTIRPDGSRVDSNGVWLSSWYLDNLNALYSAPLDHALWRAPNEKSPIASRLYEFLFFKFHGGRQSCEERAHPQRLVFDYTKMMMTSLYLAPAPPRDVLVIGLGGGTLPAALVRVLPEARIEVVEIDPAILRVARTWFGFQPDPRITVTIQDARVFVKRAQKAQRKYDLVLLDAFDHQYIPEHLLTREYLAEVRSILRPGAVLGANTFSSSRLGPNAQWLMT